MKLIMKSSLNHSLFNLFCCLLLLLSAAACEKNNEVDIATKKPVENPDAARLILVSGVTGRQGGAVAKELLSRGYRVRGLSRNPESERAQQLAGLGIEMVKGDFNDINSFRTATSVRSSSRCETEDV